MLELAIVGIIIFAVLIVVAFFYIVVSGTLLRWAMPRWEEGNQQSLHAPAYVDLDGLLYNSAGKYMEIGISVKGLSGKVSRVSRAAKKKAMYARKKALILKRKAIAKAKVLKKKAIIQAKRKAAWTKRRAIKAKRVAAIKMAKARRRAAQVAASSSKKAASISAAGAKKVARETSKRAKQFKRKAGQVTKEATRKTKGAVKKAIVKQQQLEGKVEEKVKRLQQRAKRKAKEAVRKELEKSALGRTAVGGAEGLGRTKRRAQHIVREGKRVLKETKQIQTEYGPVHLFKLSNSEGKINNLLSELCYQYDMTCNFINKNKIATLHILEDAEDYDNLSQGQEDFVYYVKDAYIKANAYALCIDNILSRDNNRRNKTTFKRNAEQLISDDLAFELSVI